jgi:DNA-binding MarR family transcriptional regulator
MSTIEIAPSGHSVIRLVARMSGSMKSNRGARDAGKSKTSKATEEAEEGASVELGEVLEFLRLLWGVNHGLEASSKQMDAQHGVTGPQRLVLRIVGRNPGISAGSVARVMHVHPSTLTGVLSRLESRGMLARTADPADGRRALFSLTSRGKELDGMRSGTVEAKVRGALAKLSPTRVKAAQEVLEALATALQAPPTRGEQGSKSPAAKPRAGRKPRA